MLKRSKEPNKGLWNGVGGKIEKGELPDNSIVREILEETNIAVKQEDLNFAGIVVWDSVRSGESKRSGMYAYIIDVSDEMVLWDNKEISEGRLEWKDQEWVISENNSEVVKNIPHFLPPMLQKEAPVYCQCTYEEGELTNIKLSSLEKE